MYNDSNSMIMITTIVITVIMMLMSITIIYEKVPADCFYHIAEKAQIHEYMMSKAERYKIILCFHMVSHPLHLHNLKEKQRQSTTLLHISIGRKITWFCPKHWKIPSVCLNIANYEAYQVRLFDLLLAYAYQNRLNAINFKGPGNATSLLSILSINKYVYKQSQK